MSNEPNKEPIELTVEDRAHGWRLDHYLSRLFPNYSRSLLQKAIKAQLVTLNGVEIPPSRRLRVNDRISVTLPEKPDSSIAPEPIPLKVVYEDDVMVIIDKQAGLIVHPGRGNYSGTLANALQHHFDSLSDVAGRHRPGIVHRLDRDTSGILVVAKDNQTHGLISAQFEARTVKKTYEAIAWGEVNFDTDFIETHVRTHSRNREKMTICPEGGDAREAITYYEVIERFRGFTHVRLQPHTGRTHQLRVHMQYIKHPIVADRLYGGHALLTESKIKHKSDILSQFEEEETEENSEQDVLIRRQALHARKLELTHPVTNERMTFETELPDDIQSVLTALKTYRSL